MSECNECKHFRSSGVGDKRYDIWCAKTHRMDYWNYSIAENCEFYEEKECKTCKGVGYVSLPFKNMTLKIGYSELTLENLIKDDQGGSYEIPCPDCEDEEEE